MASLNSELQALEDQLNSLLTDITALKTSVDTTNTLATELRTDHATNKTIIDELKTDVNALITDAIAIRAPLAGVISGSGTWDPGSLVDGAGETSASITATGAALGDFVLVSAPYDLQGITCSGYVDATNSVKIRLQNETAGTIDLASGTWRVRVLPQASFAAPAAMAGTTTAASSADTLAAAAPTAVGALGTTAGT